MALGTMPLLAQERVYVRDAGPGAPGRLLRAAIAGPHAVLRSDSALTIDGDTVGTTLIVLAADVRVETAVRGDIIVVDGDLFIRPDAHIAGDAVAIGGGVYPSTLAVIDGEIRAFRDVTFTVESTPQGLALDYRVLTDIAPPLFSLPGMYGLRLPSYNRVDGAVLPVGPRISLDTARFTIDPLVAYRSDLGAIDPALGVQARLGRRNLAVLHAGRGTFTNDDWIRSDFMNSITTLVIGRDTRNYFRGDRIEATIERLFEGRSRLIAPFVGARTERAWSVGPQLGETRGPWSIFGRDDVEDGMWRPNPPIDRGRINSALAGLRGEWERGGVVAEWLVGGEYAWESPLPDDFVQTTIDGALTFPTFRTHRFELYTHVVLTSGGAPRQRFAYLGGSGTLPTFDLLEFGGDQLLYLETEYIIPIERIEIKLLGTPEIRLRHMLGAAGVGELPDLEQNVGVRLRLGFFAVEYLIEPVEGDTHFGLGLSLFR